MPSRDTLSKGWTFSQVPSEIIPEVKEEWKECSKVPTSVHVELIRLGEIEHPYKGLAEWDSQCELSCCLTAGRWSMLMD